MYTPAGTLAPPGRPGTRREKKNQFRFFEPTPTRRGTEEERLFDSYIPTFQQDSCTPVGGTQFAGEQENKRLNGNRPLFQIYCGSKNNVAICDGEISAHTAAAPRPLQPAACLRFEASTYYVDKSRVSPGKPASH